MLIQNQKALAQLRAWISMAQEAARGELISEVERELAKELERIVRKAWAEGREPGGAEWSGAYGRISLHKTGSLFRGLKVEIVGRGVRVSVDSPKRGRHTLAEIHQYGGNIRSRFNGSRRRSFEGSSIGAHAGRALGAKPQVFFSGGHKWRKYTTRMPATPLLPEAGTLPKEWADAIERVVLDVLERWGTRDRTSG